MYIQKKIKHSEVIILSTMIFLLTFLSVFVKNVQLNNYYTFIALIPFMALSCYYIYIDWKNIKRNKILCSWILFLILAFLSELQNGMILEVPILLAYTGIISFFNFDFERLSKSFIIGVMPLFIVALIAVALGNKFSSNTIGIIISFLFVSNEVYFLSTIGSKTSIMNRRSIVFIIFELLVFYVLIRINSRTALMISGVSIALLVFHVIFKNKKYLVNNFNNSNRYIKILYSVVLLMICIIFGLFIVKVTSSILTPKWRPNDISTGRFDIWRTTISNRKLFGHRYDWYAESGLFGPHKGPHNMIIGVLGFAGIVPLISIIIVIGGCIYKLVSNYLKQPTNINAILLIMFITSNLKGLTESLIFQTSYQLYNIFFIIPLVFIDSKNKYEENSSVDRKIITLLVSFFVLIMLINIYGSVLNYSIDNVLYIIKRYI
uniref:O-antigen ligase domain-containing protein n=1 Tax=Erysipelothrix rhusiopathiae TaxID=1648 RepID=A0A6S6I5W5_ERYRH|nr:hypothetical protein [Erysipelothrix rhusiopathiae]